MKRFIVGSLIAAFLALAGSAQAVTIVEKDNFKYELKGDWQIQINKKEKETADADVDYDDLELKNHVEYKINENLTAFGQLDFCFKDSANKPERTDNQELEEAYIGLKFQNTKFFIGKTDSAGDEFGVAATIESLDIGDDCFDKFGKVKGDDLIGISSKIGNIFSVYATYESKADSSDSADNGQFFDIFAAVEVSGLSVGAAYQTIHGEGTDDDTNTMGIQLSYDAKVVKIGVDYSVTDDGDDNNESMWNVSVVIPVDTITIGLGVASKDLDDDSDSVMGYYANVVYQFPTAKNVSVFAEVRNSDDDSDDYEMGYTAGMRLKF